MLKLMGPVCQQEAVEDPEVPIRKIGRQTGFHFSTRQTKKCITNFPAILVKHGGAQIEKLLIVTHARSSNLIKEEQ